MWRIWKDGKNVASFSERSAAYTYGISKSWFIKDPRKLKSGWWIDGVELREDRDEG